MELLFFTRTPDALGVTWDSDFWTGQCKHTASIELLNIYVSMFNSSFVLITLILMYYLFIDVIIFVQNIYAGLLFLTLWEIKYTQKLLSIYKMPSSAGWNFNKYTKTVFQSMIELRVKEREPEYQEVREEEEEWVREHWNHLLWGYLLISGGL